MTTLTKDDIIKLYGPNPDFWDWTDISHISLSEDFIREFKDKVNWSYISSYQTLSEDFIREFKDKIKISYFVKYNPNCPPD